MGFVEGKMEEEKVLGGAVLPKVLQPSCTGERRTCDLAEMVHNERVWHGALLFRGIEVFSLSLTAELQIPCFSLKEFPSKVFFFCSNPSPAGGDISIVPSHIIVEKMEEMVPDFVTRLSETGSIFRVKTRKDEVSVATIASKTWKCLLQIVTKSNQKDGSTEFIYGPMNPIRDLGGKRVWFNNILGYTDNERDLEVSFSDGSPFPVEAVDAYKNILEEKYCINLSWQKGDILLVDNLSVQYSRRPRKKPPSVILVSIWK
ncbi:clavaminate synthase-like protein [Cinnamomum micranthum f. kanehirae]|uniref:Clavaminate synthase-like protein n=1 Tax=Cinnamomum micranthum f. kanehirae TaxID=337451 RepID=A0A443PIB5_9MAGN|nr:clavaminate synthase-like protein [Cinnamomum micranthum f. kanehirae]